MAQDTTSLETALGYSGAVSIRGKEIKVHEITMEHLSTFYSTCAPFFKEFDNGGRLTRKEGALGDAPEDFTLFGVICDHADAFMDACEMVTDAGLPFLRSLRPDEFYNIAAKVIEVNGGFFVHALAPALVKLAAGLRNLGATLSEGSLRPDTTTPTFADMP